MKASTSKSKPYKVVVWGATGFTGKIVAEYLHNYYPLGDDQPLTWALAGRSESKLNSVLKELGFSAPVLVADSFEIQSLESMASKAEVIITLVGPYSIYGTNLVDVCARSGTHLVDLTGESHWVREMIDKYHDIAAKSGAKIVHSCGFDSIPADIGVFMVSEYLRRVHNTAISEVTYYPMKFGKSGFSGGTAASAMVMADFAWKEGSAARKALSDPYYLAPKESRPDYPNPSLGGGFGYDSQIPGWTAPFVFAAHDSKIVHRSNALLSYGKLHYREVIPFKGKVLGFVPAVLVSSITAMMSALILFPLTRSIIQTFLPKPGEGPSKELREASFFEIQLEGKGENGVRVRGIIGSDKGDCGYQETAKMLVECAAALALEDGALPLQGGILTPASAIGMSLIARLRNHEMTLSVETVSKGFSDKNSAKKK